MSYPVLISCVIAVWALLSMIGSDRVQRQQIVDAARLAAEAAEKRRVAAAAEADAAAVAH